MFQRLYELSRTLPPREGWERVNEGMPAEYNRGLALCFGRRGEWLEVRTVVKREDAHHPDVVYRSGPPNGTDLTPCCKLAGNTGPRLLRAVEGLLGHPTLPEEKRTWLRSSQAAFRGQAEKIWSEVEAKREAAHVDGKARRAFVFWAEADGSPVYAWPEAKALLEQAFLRPFSKGGARAGVCSVCGERASEVFGNFSVLACYNLDKPGSVAGGFRESDAHRNLPVCGGCAFGLAEAFAFAETNLASSMAGQSYLVLPYASDEETRDLLREVLRDRPERFHLGRAKDLVAEELELVEELQNRGDQLAFALVFFKAEQASWRIQAEVQQLLPSRMAALHRAAQELARAEDLLWYSKEGERPFHPGANTFRDFSGSSEKESAETLRAWLVALFRGERIDARHFLHRLVGRIVATGKANPGRMRWIVREAWGLYRYALRTGLIESQPLQEAPEMSEAVPESNQGRYIREHPAFFDRPEKVVAFLTGCYASTVASVQRRERGADPFTKKFVGRMLTREHLQRLYREGHGKLAQYGKLGYVMGGLDPDLATAWIACGHDWKISHEESTFAFTIGYSLAYRIGAPAEDAAENGKE